MPERPKKPKQESAQYEGESRPENGKKQDGHDDRPQKGTIRGRLLKLDALFKEGLITKDEYDRKRAKLISDL